MNKMNKIWVCICLLTGGLLFAGQTGQAASAEKQLQKGIEAYQNQNNDKALEYFIDVLMNGDNDQVSLANKYIDAIHNNIGGIKNPVEVNVNFPEQPTQTLVDPAANLANYGQAKLDTLTTSSEQVIKDTQAAWGPLPKTLTEQIEERQLEGYTQPGSGLDVKVISRDKAAQPISAVGGVEVGKTASSAQPQAIPVEKAVQQINSQVATAQNEVNQAIAQDKAAVAGLEQKVADAQMQAQAQAVAAVEPLTTTTAYVVPAATTQDVAATDVSSTFTNLTSEGAVRARSIYTAQKLQSMADAAISGLSEDKGVHVYLRSDGRIDALDIDDGVLFQGSAFRPEALPVLNSIYELLALNQGTRYIILPSGSYTDDVTLAGIREAMALKSYLVKRGISQGKLYYNMGLVDQEVPAQFSNLKGLSIVFDYDAKLPTQLLENEGKETAPLLSMAIVPQCHAIDRALGEAYAIDFSVLETVNTLDNWVLQVVQHGRDGNYYIVRQLEGFSPVYHQILWNGRKGIIGPELPCGKYTIVLTGVDLKGNKQTLRRRVVVKCAAEEAPACQTGSCKEKAAAASKTTLNYKAARLWVKPGRVMRQEVSAVSEQTVNTQAVSKETSSDSYTVTKTVRNIVTEDTGASSGVSSSIEYAPMPVGGYAPAPAPAPEAASPYDIPYEE